MELRNYILKGLRKVYRKIAKREFPSPLCETDRTVANKLIYDLLMAEKPCMISRFGSTEMSILLNYMAVHGKQNIITRCFNYITNNVGLPWWDEANLRVMKNNSGIFPSTIDILEKFSERYYRDIPEIDLLGSFNHGEIFMPLKPDLIKVHLECLYPFWVEKPWTKALTGKKVLVIHPFAETISSQYDRRRYIFSDSNILPAFELKTLKAVQTIADNNSQFKDWFDALKWMEEEMTNIDFDICILGCGAYGLPLAATAKKIGKKSFHIGGGLQLLFGIKGKRWDNDGYHWKNLPQLYTNYSSLYNEYWVRPSRTETPKAAKNVEGACYW